MSILRTFVLATLFLLAAAALGCSQQPASQTAAKSAASAPVSQLDTILQRGVIKVGFDTFKPWAMKDKKGDYVGFEIEVARKLAEDMGVKVEFVPTKWSGIIPALLTGKFDIIIGGMSITPQRNLKVNFSLPYEYSGMSLVASRELADGRSSINDFNNPATSIAVRLGTTAAEAAKNFLPKAKILFFDEESQTIQELLNQRVHAVVASNPLPMNLSKEYAEQLYLPMKDDFTREPIAFAVRKGDPDFLNWLNNWVRVTMSKGWLQNRYEYWFYTNDWESLIM
ncbi:transporter substrate-binding domain-containing protein [Pseudodesulfovibrio indicus]|uniref:Amino acid ABC transporter substrate-binding protein n=1 Tax=Pseudodesulfovibrio indicus TaxID=1716143 RepID=A0A126QQA7_9BACT|nr:transporter substrate-binding domain-containing protein [Pseudodesulfovibrio indicus]AMK11907.1 amino acid ABC transporter substrate-binding protein [Pseudodesulfovibrio indicus]TDT87172.1 amino acid ABC transporter substrate-binding protein (PAAT family) [Pseudodesulfovibrio indicus]